MTLCVGLSVPLCVGLSVPLCETVRLPVPLSVPLRLLVGVPLTVGVALGEALGAHLRLRTTLLLKSAMKMSPLPSTATPRGALKEGEKPLAAPAAPVPASVVTAPPGYVTHLMRWLFASTTTSAPLAAGEKAAW